MFRRGVVGLVLGALAAAPAPALADEAVTVRNNPAHTSAASEPNVSAPLQAVWSRSLGTTSGGYPLIAGGRVFVFTAGQGGASTLTALSAADGSTLWSRDGSTLIAYDGGRVFALSGGGTLQSLDAASGATQWTVQLPGQYSFSSPPTATGGVVYAGGAGSGGTLYAVRETDGKVLWTQSVMNGDDSSPAVVDGRVFVSYAGPQTYAFDAASGTLAWHYSGCCEGGGGDTPAVAGGRVWARDYAGEGYVYNEPDGKLLDHYSGVTPALAGGLALIPRTQSLVAMDATSGVNRWTYTDPNVEVGVPTVVDSTAYVPANDGRVIALRLGDGAALGTVSAGTTMPSLAAGDGELVASSGGTITAYTGQGAPAPTGPTGTTAPAPAAPAPAAPAPSTTSVTSTTAAPAPAAATPVKGSTAGCRVSKASKKTFIVTCPIKAPRATFHGRILRADGKLVARVHGSVRNGKLRFTMHLKRKLKPGRYRLVLGVRSGGHTVGQRRTITIS